MSDEWTATAVRRASAPDYDSDRLGAAMSAAFLDDASSVYLWPDPAERAAALRWYYGVLVPRLGFGGGRVYVDAAGRGQSVWLAPGRGIGLAAGVRAGALGFLPRFGARAMWRLKTLADSIDGLRRTVAPDGHWYLLLLGVEPEAQGQGVGSALLAPMLAEADAAGAAVYLETSTAANLPLYRAKGFEVRGEAAIPDGPLNWGLVRPPA